MGQREAEEEAKIKKLEQEGTAESNEEIEKIKRLQKLHVGNICHDKYSSKHVKGKASGSASPQAAVDTKLKVAASDESQFMDGYDDFLKSNLKVLEEYAAIDEEDEKSEEYILANTQ